MSKSKKKPKPKHTRWEVRTVGNILVKYSLVLDTPPTERKGAKK